MKCLGRLGANKWRIPVLLTLLFLLTTSLYRAPVWAESSSVSEERSERILEELEQTDLEGKTPFMNDSRQPYNRAMFIFNSEAYYSALPISKGYYAVPPEDEEGEPPVIKDPLQPYNRAMFTFNDKAYYYALKPIYKGYRAVLPEKARVSVRNFFSNVRMPVRFVNSLLQGKFKGAGTEIVRFVMNSTVGVGGLFDPATSQFHLEKQNRDFGQTLGKYGVGAGFFIQWPLLGPSTLRDSLGFAVDLALNPFTLISFFIGPLESFGVTSYDVINELSLDGGDIYESITTPAIDPYIALQDAYLQNRMKKIKE